MPIWRLDDQLVEVDIADSVTLEVEENNIVCYLENYEIISVGHYKPDRAMSY